MLYPNLGVKEKCLLPDKNMYPTDFDTGCVINMGLNRLSTDNAHCLLYPGRSEGDVSVQSIL